MAARRAPHPESLTQNAASFSRLLCNWRDTCDYPRRRSRESGNPVLTGAHGDYWIPAFARMTCFDTGHLLSQRPDSIGCILSQTLRMRFSLNPHGEEPREAGRLEP